MNLNRWLAILLMSIFSTVALFADQTEDLRNKLKHAQGKERINILQNLYDLSLESDDIGYQLRCINQLISECRHQGERAEEGDARVQKIILFYNNDLNDSIYEQTPPTLDFLEGIQNWKNYYETWTVLVETYNFSGHTNTGLKEVNAMYDDAKSRDNTYGMGMAYYAMGNVYANMYNHEEAASSYQKSIDLLINMEPKPMQLSDIFAYYIDVLEQMKDYRKINEVTETWRNFLTNYYANIGSNTESENRWAYYYLACAQSALGLDDLERASEMLDEVKKRCPNEESFLNQRWLYYRGELCRKQGFFDEALALNDRRMRFLEDISDKSELIRIRKQRAEILEGLGRYREAAQMYNEMYIINDSINTHDTKRQLTEMNTLFHVDELKMQQAKAQTRYAIIISTIIVLALVIFIFFRMRSAKRLKIAHEKLEDAHEKLEETHSKLETTHQELLTAYDQLEETTIAKERIESDLRIARDIQSSMVPHTFPDREDLDLYASMTPAKEVGGDLYGYHLIDDQLYFCLGDVSGKGVPASLFMAQATRLFRTLAAQKMMPAEIATRINDALSGEDNELMMFVTMFLGLVDLKTGHLFFCNAGHNPPVFGSEFIDMLPNAPIGMWPGLEYEGEEIADISNKPFFVYTDGLNEAENRQQEQFTDERLLEIMANTPFESSEKTVEMLKAEVEKHRDGAEPNDDLTMLCLMVKKKENIQ
jgi:serine phosphatase RsbU (regulator of sigma subunit)